METKEVAHHCKEADETTGPYEENVRTVNIQDIEMIGALTDSGRLDPPATKAAASRGFIKGVGQNHVARFDPPFPGSVSAIFKSFFFQWGNAL